MPEDYLAPHGGASPGRDLDHLGLRLVSGLFKICYKNEQISCMEFMAAS